MKKHFFNLVAVLILFSCNTNSQTSSNLSAAEFKEAFENDEGIILDVRTEQELSNGYIENASTIDFYDADFEKKLCKIQKDKTVYVYCKSGGRSKKAAQLLTALGQSKVVNLSGGFMAWKKANLPVFNQSSTLDKKIQELSIADFDSIISQHELVLIDFHTLWCAPCRKMSPIIDELEKDYQGKIHIFRVDMDKSEAVADMNNIEAVPTLVLFENEKEIWRNTGLMSKQEIVKILSKTLD